MASEVNERLSIKNILFTKALPNYKIPVPTEGYKIFSCTDCGDKFLFESSYQLHTNRKSLQITYMCRHCGIIRVYYNRCQLLSHIRSHVFKTATINLGDINIETLPLESSEIEREKSSESQVRHTAKSNYIFCIECKTNISDTETVFKDRVKHYMQHSDKVYACPVCLFTLPSSCGLKAHLRIHLKKPPFCCPECGINLPNRITAYPYNHDCEGFKMMRVTSRVKCYFESCKLFHPNNYKMHLKNTHLNKVFKCPVCSLAGYNEVTVTKHVTKCTKGTGKFIIYFECQQCPGNLINSHQIHKHLEIHLSTEKNIQQYPCWSCGQVFKEVYDLLRHHVRNHNASHEIKSFVSINSNVFKRCITCHKSVTYRNLEENIDNIPFQCPYCTISNSHTAHSPGVSETCQIRCYICKNKLQEDWSEIKKHLKKNHNVEFFDLKVVIKKLDLMKLQKRSSKTLNTKVHKANKHVHKNKDVHLKTISQIERQQSALLSCSLCEYYTDEKINFESHVMTHKDPCMAYQCMECGQSFAVKPSFSTHLLLEHGITDVDIYSEGKNCFNKNALEKYHIGIDANEDDKPLEANQCSICKEKFSDQECLEKHFRVHGMAFLIKNNQKCKSP